MGPFPVGPDHQPSAAALHDRSQEPAAAAGAHGFTQPEAAGLTSGRERTGPVCSQHPRGKRSTPALLDRGLNHFAAIHPVPANATSSPTKTVSRDARPPSAGYSVTLARGLGVEALAARIAGAIRWSKRTAVPVGELTGDGLVEALDAEYGDAWDGMGLRLGVSGGWTFAVAYGGWFGELGDGLSISEGGAEVVQVEYEEENGKPVPPTFHYCRDGRTVCSFNLHLDDSWGNGQVVGDPEVTRAVKELLRREGLPDEERVPREVHRATLGVLERHFGLTLPRALVLEAPLAAVLLVEA